MHQKENRDMESVFPAGLEQPEGSFRFSGDALLLADFAAGTALPEQAVFADLGTGCGIVALAVLRKRTRWRGFGMEIQPELSAAAERNAAGLGLAERFSVVTGDVAAREDRLALRATPGTSTGGKTGGAESLPLFDAVFCNPPWRREGSGRTPPSLSRRIALFGTERTFSVFFSAADALLKNGGQLVVVSGAERTAELLAALPGRLHPEHLRFVFTRRAAPATFVLLRAKKNGRADLCVDSLEAFA